MSDRLKPCPFCGGEAHILPPTCRPETPYDPSDRLYPVARCGSCGAEAAGESGDSGRTAIAAWSHRAGAGPTIPPGDGAAGPFVLGQTVNGETYQAAPSPRQEEARLLERCRAHLEADSELYAEVTAYIEDSRTGRLDGQRRLASGGEVKVTTCGIGNACRIMEHDGMYICTPHDRTWGAVTQPDEPCAGRVAPVGGEVERK